MTENEDEVEDAVEERVPCSCCHTTGSYDEGYGSEECSACSGTGYED